MATTQITPLDTIINEIDALGTLGVFTPEDVEQGKQLFMRELTAAEDPAQETEIYESWILQLGAYAEVKDIRGKVGAQ